MKNDIAFICIGDELLLGQIADANLQTLAKKLDEIGRYISEVRIIGDDAQKIIETVHELSQKYNLVFTSGGVGPTHDDITTMCVAEAFEVDVVLNAQAKMMIEKSLDKHGKKYLQSHEKMALIPEDATLIQNDISGAPGFKIGNVCVMAGVPDIFANMVENVLKTMMIGNKLNIEKIYSEISETQIAKKLEEIASVNFNVAIGIYPHYNKEYKTEIVVKSVDLDALQNCVEAINEMLENKL